MLSSVIQGLEISNDNGFYIGAEELDIHLKVNGTYYNANAPEFYQLCNGSSTGVLLNLTDFAELDSERISDGADMQSVIARILDRASKNEEIGVELMNSTQYLTWLRSKGLIDVPAWNVY